VGALGLADAQGLADALTDLSAADASYDPMQELSQIQEGKIENSWLENITICSLLSLLYVFLCSVSYCLLI